jgi:hypothetical protein
MSGYGYNYENTGSQGQFNDGYQEQFQYGYHDPYSNDYGDSDQQGARVGPSGVSGYGDYGYDQPNVSSNEVNGDVLPGQDGDMDHEDGSSVSDAADDEIDFDDPRIANLPRILLMGPRRAGKTSIQVGPLFCNVCLI